jgi:hypothetical protein
VNLKLPDGTLEEYSWTSPYTTVHNIVIGKLYVDVRGKSEITNHSTGSICEIEWKERGWSGKVMHMLSGVVRDAQGRPQYKMSGCFS